MSARLFGKLLVHIVLLTLPLFSPVIGTSQDTNLPIIQNTTSLETKGESQLNLRSQPNQTSNVEGVLDNSKPLKDKLENKKPNNNISKEIKNNIIKNLSEESKSQFHTPDPSIQDQIRQPLPAINIAQPINDLDLDRVEIIHAISNPRSNASPEKSETANIFIALSTLVLSIAATSYLVYNTASLFSKGFNSTKFYKGGGSLMVFMAIQGGLLGGFLGWVLWHNIYASLAFSGPLMCLFASSILTGPRGAALGAIGGFNLGFIFGNFMSNGMSLILIGPIFTGICGSMIGNYPIFPNLKINQRYLRKMIIERNQPQPEIITTESKD